MSSTALARADAFTPEQIDIIKRDIAKGASDNELQFFLALCNRTQLDPFLHQIWMIKRRAKNEDTEKWEDRMVPQLGIDGARLIAERSGKYEGQEGPYWCGPDGIWTDCWLKPEHPVAAKVLIYKRGARVPTTGIALYAEVAQIYNGQPNSFWKKQPAFQLAKCAEMNGLRRAFPAEMSGLQIEDEPGDSEYIETTGRVIDQSTGEILTPAPPKQIEVKPAPVAWQTWANKKQAVDWAVAKTGGDYDSMAANWETFKTGLKPKSAAQMYEAWFGHVNGLVAATDAAADNTADGVFDEVDYGMGDNVPTIHMAEQPALVQGGGKVYQ